MLTMTRADESRRIIRQRITEGVELGMTDAALRRYVNEGYPYGEREYHPYEVWLRVFKEEMGTGPTGQPYKSKDEIARDEARQKAIAAGQGVML